MIRWIMLEAYHPICTPIRLHRSTQVGNQGRERKRTRDRSNEIPTARITIPGRPHGALELHSQDEIITASAASLNRSIGRMTASGTA
jgi:hypothetical protein